jgi:hypothetical protein
MSSGVHPEGHQGGRNNNDVKATSNNLQRHAYVEVTKKRMLRAGVVTQLVPVLFIRRSGVTAMTCIRA